ncbi:DUF3037 domain-containing protein [Chitinophagaceae bacterium LB-8]|uniref:DUF3037 domain-containing protein n=1 Tax=Paraflavisolibacter caeni TaxID=2982496 RepID=A0A9X2XYQ2_9BACT|nr:DUF3037 domain-containing protein [Paraflavisolibacter caeni]MCU7551989.1 DUF3037 domain-containing protein [Paraflavisolibacter caeni]
MQEKHLFEYAVIRVVPRVEREEFMNVGIILYCKKPRFLQCLFHLNSERLQAFSPALDISEVEQYLHSIERICAGSKDAGPIGKLDVASRFRWLTATRSTVVQTSKVHPGFSTDPKETLQHLYGQLVL